ncbi:hypothetical protein BDA96_04G031000 [Sorghum bicolor]|uniref:Uncharacterized protein n=1 Tax=Sorghum bicolor TaxID=4558 RepID=A0A921UGS4_SORBI|nr:hypothetical protein BDA96_04G031000 [Sorghum bicolor]
MATTISTKHTGNKKSCGKHQWRTAISLIKISTKPHLLSPLNVMQVNKTPSF